MLFIDGTWLYANTGRLGEHYARPDFHVDFGRLPRVLAREVGRQLGFDGDLDVVRTWLFGSYATNHDPIDDDAVQRRLDFFSMLTEEYHYEVETFSVNFRGRRLRRSDRDPDDPFEPVEKSVDIALATAMMYYAAIPNAYDIGIAVVGDADFVPMLQHVRRLGKRVAIASVRSSCAQSLSDPADPERVKDFDLIWLDDHLDDLELRFEPHELDCESPTHDGDRRVWTTYHPRKGQRFFCDNCRSQFARDRAELGEARAYAYNRRDSDEDDGVAGAAIVGEVLDGEVKRKFPDKGYGFIAASDGQDYFFHMSKLRGGLDFIDVREGDLIEFEVERAAGRDRAGAAHEVRPRVGGHALAG
jgi:cold shock CspA family protein